jgi:hypothetical protein
MPDKCALRTSKVFLAAAAVGLMLSPCGWSQVCKSRCEPSIAVHHSPFFGYYRTCWRTWPGGQPPCPCQPILQAAEPALRAGTSERTIEQLPLPRPEEPEMK